MNRRISGILFLLLIVLGATILAECLFYRQDKGKWVRKLEERLHRQENRAEEILRSFRDSVDIDAREWEDDLSFFGIRQGKLFFWTNERAGTGDLLERLTGGERLVKLGNTYYEIRRRKYKDTDYFALIRMLDAYPYTSQYVKNKFADFLKIPQEDAERITLSVTADEGGQVIRDKDGNALFLLTFSDDYQERVPAYWLVALYLLVFLSLFYVYSLLLKQSMSWKRQLLWCCGFVFLLLGVRFFMQTFHLPGSFPTNYSSRLSVI